MNKLAFSNSQLNNSHFHPCRFIKRRSRSGLTLVELMIAVALTLVIIGAMVKAFKATSDQISLGRAKMDMHNKIRVVSEQLRRDLQNATRSPNPSDTADGYFEYVEGEETDGEHATSVLSFIGDHDDILALTVRSEGEPFRGRWLDDKGTVATGDDELEYVESYLAEVVWWVFHDDTNGDDEVSYDENVRLYRRVLLIRPDLPTPVFTSSFTTFYESNDLAVRRDFETGDLVMNSLEDLARRENRFAHNAPAAGAFPSYPDPAFFPHEFITTGGGSIYTRFLTGDMEGQDLMLNNCMAFDIKVFDPAAHVFRPDPVLATAAPGAAIGQVIDFDDPGFNDPALTSDVIRTFPIGTNPDSYPQVGGYVNLGYDPTDYTPATPIFPLFTTPGIPRWFAAAAYPNNLTAPRPYEFESNTFCTWWNGYERDGIDQDGDGDIDEGADGIDNDSADGVDDNEEREARPPYAYPVRSIQVSIRMIEKNTNQVLQKSIRESFVPN